MYMTANTRNRQRKKERFRLRRSVSSVPPGPLPFFQRIMVQFLQPVVLGEQLRAMGCLKKLGVKVAQKSYRRTAGTSRKCNIKVKQA